MSGKLCKALLKETTVIHDTLYLIVCRLVIARKKVEKNSNYSRTSMAWTPLEA